MKPNLTVRVLVCVLALTCFLAAAPEAHAATLNVDKTNPACSDVTGTPYCTIQAAVNAAGPGDTVNVVAGTYVEVVNVNKSIVLKGNPGVVIKPDNGTPLLDGGVRRAAFIIASIANVTVEGFEIDGTGGDVHFGILGANANNS
jgi:nitrous oxidase accessory protein NosD